MFDLSWLFLRLAALFTLEGFLIDIEIFALVVGFLFCHVHLGLKTIISDYIHIKKVRLALIILIRISAIELTRYVLELLL
uniref:succinate dehydrogenase subunit 4 n=1 Tax=Grateloupia elliptica TaxID=118371 RepID=UPI0020297DEF|nr:succinate dehydrogenase subunit 4 [Grateloupia elliptica]UQJ72544.1 succinate dehydrogenase subunit 4 [Grateloupia elliptica]UYI31690.1 succinate dehydrogenase subunit 4 [Grateloupia elliptica]